MSALFLDSAALAAHNAQYPPDKQRPHSASALSPTSTADTVFERIIMEKQSSSASGSPIPGVEGGIAPLDDHIVAAVGRMRERALVEPLSPQAALSRELEKAITAEERAALPTSIPIISDIWNSRVWLGSALIGTQLERGRNCNHLTHLVVVHNNEGFKEGEIGAKLSLLYRPVAAACDLDPYLEDITKFVSEALLDPTNRIAIICNCGETRSGYAMVHVLSELSDVPWERVFEYVRSKRPCLDETVKGMHRE